MEIASRFDEKYKLEKCPKCAQISSNFLIMSNISLACLAPHCGAVFVRKAVLVSLDIKQMLNDQTAALTCDICGKTFKDKAGLGGHKRTSNKCNPKPKK